MRNGNEYVAVGEISSVNFDGGQNEVAVTLIVNDAGIENLARDTEAGKEIAESLKAALLRASLIVDRQERVNCDHQMGRPGGDLRVRWNERRIGLARPVESNRRARR